MFEALDNFRDFGGYPVADGRRVKTGLLFRSANHGALTDADLQTLASHAITAIVDLRRTDERKRTPSRRWPGFDGQVIENDIGDEVDPWLDFIRNADELSATVMRDYMIGFYAAAPLEERHLDLFSRYFEALETTSGAVLIHCAAGKDRTGLLAALTHHLVGAPDERILHDYLLTNAQVDYAARAPSISQWIQSATGREISDQATIGGLVVDEAHLRTGLAAMVKAYGSLDAYLEDGLGVTPRRKTAILARLLG